MRGHAQIFRFMFVFSLLIAFCAKKTTFYAQNIVIMANVIYYNIGVILWEEEETLLN